MKLQLMDTMAQRQTPNITRLHGHLQTFEFDVPWEQIRDCALDIVVNIMNVTEPESLSWIIFPFSRMSLQ